MSWNIFRRFSILGLSLIATTGLLVGCGGENKDSLSEDSSEQHVEKQSEKEHGHDHHEEESQHEDDGHENHHKKDRTEHFQGKEAKNYEEALSNMKEANSQLETLLDQEELGGEDFHKIHRMSYTMENALKVIRENSDENYEDVAKSLESVHLASEKRDVETVRREGENYLNAAKTILKKR